PTFRTTKTIPTVKRPAAPVRPSRPVAEPAPKARAISKAAAAKKWPRPSPRPPRRHRPSAVGLVPQGGEIECLPRRLGGRPRPLAPTARFRRNPTARGWRPLLEKITGTRNKPTRPQAHQERGWRDLGANGLHPS